MHMSTRTLFGLKEVIHLVIQLSHSGLSYTEQECQESLIQGKICNQQNLNKGLEYL